MIRKIEHNTIPKSISQDARFFTLTTGRTSYKVLPLPRRSVLRKIRKEIPVHTSKAQTSLTKNRRPALLDVNLDKSLLNYAAAATAAGVGLFALAQPAEAKIIYTAANIPITVNGPPVPIDLNHDGITDFTIINSSGTCEAKGIHKLGCSFAAFYAVGDQTGNAIGSSQTFNGAQCAALLHAGHVIGPGKKFLPNHASMFENVATSANSGPHDCPWTGRGNPGGFLGLQFAVGSNTFYGWALVELTRTGPVLAGYAYENNPGGSIVAGSIKGADKADASQAPALTAPQPATLGILANGARGLPAWRRPEEMN
jgi:hypothetical protein